MLQILQILSNLVAYSNQQLTAQYCDKKEVEKLINCGGDPNAEDFDGYTPLFYAGLLKITWQMLKYPRHARIFSLIKFVL